MSRAELTLNHLKIHSVTAAVIPQML